MIHFGTLRIDRVHDENTSCVRMKPFVEYLTICGVPFTLGPDVAQVSGQQAERAHLVDCASCLEKDSLRLPALVIEICSKGYMDHEQLREIGVPQDVIEMIFDGIAELSDIIVTVQEVTEGEFPLLLPPGPVCRKCGHQPCPFCQNWCDVVNPDDDADQFQCCDGVCDFPADAHAAWIAEIADILEDAEEQGRGVVQKSQRELQDHRHAS